MSDIVIAGNTYSQVPSIIVPKSGGGNAQFWEMDGDLSFLGVDLTYIGNACPLTKTVLADTAYNGWTPSTTAKDIIAAGTNDGTFTATGLDQYEYVVRWVWSVDCVYNGASGKAQVERAYGNYLYWIHRRPYGIANFETMNAAYNYSTCLMTGMSYEIYRNTSGTRTWTTNPSYGIYPTNTNCTLSSTSSNNPTVTVKAPKFTARCSTTYLTTANAGKIDQEASCIKWQCDYYRIRPIGIIRGGYCWACDMYNNPMGEPLAWRLKTSSTAATYKMTANMTWADWIASTFNTINMVNSGGYVSFNSDTNLRLYDTSNVAQTVDMVISQGATYTQS